MKLINYNFDVYALKKPIDWQEFDTKHDFKNYEKNLKKWFFMKIIGDLNQNYFLKKNWIKKKV